MIVVAPQEITAAMLTSNVAAGDYPTWVEATNYANVPGANPVQVVYGITVYALTVAASQGQRPDMFPGAWAVVGVINRWKMFDPLRSPDTDEGKTKRAEQITVDLVTTDRINTVALFGLEATWVNVEYFDNLGERLYQRRLNTATTYGMGDYAGWRRARISRSSTLFFSDIPGVFGGRLRVTIERPGRVAACGKLVMGYSRKYGCVQYVLPGDRQDMSTQERDDFGNLRLVPRQTIRTLTFEIKIDSELLWAADEELSKRSGLPSVYYGSERWLFSLIYGFPKRIEPRLESKGESKMIIKVEQI